jgi:hypothetical protein
MAADPRDRFAGFTGEEHIFLILDDPLRMIRDEVEYSLREQVADTIVDAITMEGEPKFLTVGQRSGDEAMSVQHVGFCLRARLALHHEGSEEREELDATLTFLFGHLDRPGQQQLRTYFDLQRDAAAAFTDDTFDARFETFRSDLS